MSEAAHWRGRLVGAAAVIVDEGGRVLLVRHSYGPENWELPGGASEPGETIVATALREVREETGLSVRPERLTGIYYRADNDSHHFVFACTAGDGAAPFPASSEISDCRYWPTDDLPRPISEFTVRRLRDALAEDAVSGLPVEVKELAWLQ
jgi:8-oxo-dGTP diphosphatase